MVSVPGVKHAFPIVPENERHDLWKYAVHVVWFSTFRGTINDIIYAILSSNISIPIDPVARAQAVYWVSRAFPHAFPWFYQHPLWDVIADLATNADAGVFKT